MLLLPFERHVFKNPLHHDELLDRLIGVIEKPKTFHGKGWFFPDYKNTKPYAGSLTRSKISVNRILTGYRSSFNPIISGKISPVKKGTQITMNFYLHPLIIIFMNMWLGLAGFALLSSIHQGLTANEWDGIEFSVGLFLFGYLLMILPFKYEVRKSKQFFTQLLGSS